MQSQVHGKPHLSVSGNILGLDPLSFAYVSSVLGRGTKKSTPLAFKCPFVTVVNNLLRAWQCMQRHCLGDPLGADYFGTMTMGLAHGETLLTIILAFSKSSNSFFTQDA